MSGAYGGGDPTSGGAGGQANRVCVPNHPANLRVYQIGNSLTWDSQPPGIAAMSGGAGSPYTTGYHILCGSSLDTIWSKPDETCVEPVPEFGRYKTALLQHAWDVVVMQVYPGATLGSDVASIRNFIDLTRQNPDNTQTRFYVYSGWPTNQQYDQDWERLGPWVDASPMATAREYFHVLMDRVHADVDPDVLYIPIAEVFYQLGKRAEKGEVSGYAQVSAFFRDKDHMNEMGRYVAGITVWSSVFARDPMGLTRPDGYYNADELPLLYPVLQETVRGVLTQDARSGIAHSCPP